MRFAYVLFFLLAACGPTQSVAVSPNEAADLSATYHDRVWVRGIRHASGVYDPAQGALIDDGAAVITSLDHRIELRPDDRLLLTIRYREGDLALNNEGVVHREASIQKISGGIALALAGTFAFIGTIAGASANCINRPEEILNGLSYSMCVLGWGTLAGAAATTLATGLAFTIRGAVPTNLTVTPRGASVAITF